MVKNKYKYNLILYDYNTYLDSLGTALSEVLGYDLTQIGNIINFIMYKQSYCIKSYTNYKDAVRDCDLLAAYDIICSLEKELQVD